MTLSPSPSSFEEMGAVVVAFCWLEFDFSKKSCVLCANGDLKAFGDSTRKSSQNLQSVSGLK
jgi:hypothetical protein